MTEIKTERDREMFKPWLYSLVITRPGVGWIRLKLEPGAPAGSPRWVAEAPFWSHNSLLSQALEQGAGLEVD